MTNKNIHTESPSKTIQSWFGGMWAVFEKDLKQEIRSRYAIQMLLLFVASTLFLIILAIGNETIDTSLQAGLVWIVIVFSSVIGLGRSFISEVEQGTVLLLRLHVPASMIYAGKLLFNVLLVFGLNLVAMFGFWMILNISVNNWFQLLLVLFLGAVGISGTTTLLAAIIARASGKGPLLAVLAFPLLIPLLMSVVEATTLIFEASVSWQQIATPCVTLFAFGGAVITASVLLFDFIWHD